MRLWSLFRDLLLITLWYECAAIPSSLYSKLLKHFEDFRSSDHGHMMLLKAFLSGILRNSVISKSNRMHFHGFRYWKLTVKTAVSVKLLDFLSYFPLLKGCLHTVFKGLARQHYSDTLIYWSFSKYKTCNVDFELIWALIIDTPLGESEWRSFDVWMPPVLHQRWNYQVSANPSFLFSPLCT